MIRVTRHPSHWSCGIRIPRQEGSVHSLVPWPALSGSGAWHDPRPRAPLVEPGSSGRGLQRVRAHPHPTALPRLSRSQPPRLRPIFCPCGQASLRPPSGLQAVGSPGRHCVYTPQLAPGRGSLAARGDWHPRRPLTHRHLGSEWHFPAGAEGARNPLLAAPVLSGMDTVPKPWVLWVGGSAGQHPPTAPAQGPGQTLTAGGGVSMEGREAAPPTPARREGLSDSRREG